MENLKHPYRADAGPSPRNDRTRIKKLSSISSSKKLHKFTQSWFKRTESNTITLIANEDKSSIETNPYQVLCIFLLHKSNLWISLYNIRVAVNSFKQGTCQNTNMYVRLMCRLAFDLYKKFITHCIEKFCLYKNSEARPKIGASLWLGLGRRLVEATHGAAGGAAARSLFSQQFPSGGGSGSRPEHGKNPLASRSNEDV